MVTLSCEADSPVGETGVRGGKGLGPVLGERWSGKLPVVMAFQPRLGR